MKYGLLSGILWGLDTVILGIGLALAPCTGTPEALACASIVGSFLHDAFCALWLFGYMAIRNRLGDTLAALKTHSGKVVIAGALLGGPIGMTGYAVSIANLGAACTAIISAFYPAVGAFLAFLLLKERMSKGQLAALFLGLFGVMAMGLLSAGDSQVANAPLGLLALCSLSLVGAPRRCCALGACRTIRWIMKPPYRFARRLSRWCMVWWCFQCWVLGPLLLRRFQVLRRATFA